MFKILYNRRFKKNMWTDTRLVNAAPNFCLCASCAKSNIREGVVCPIHDKFMGTTQELKIAAPIFTCLEFEELINGRNYLDQYYDGNLLSRAKAKTIARFHEVNEELSQEWQAQRRRWAR
jgi:hypothetical protein